MLIHSETLLEDSWLCFEFVWNNNFHWQTKMSIIHVSYSVVVVYWTHVLKAMSYLQLCYWLTVMLYVTGGWRVVKKIRGLGDVSPQKK